MKQCQSNPKLTRFVLFVLLVSVLTLLGIYLPNQDNIVVKSIRIIFGSIFILFLPGFCLTFTFFDDKEIDYLERFALSFALSISIVPLLTFYANLAGLKITALNVFLISFLVIIASGIYVIYFKKKSEGEDKPTSKSKKHYA